MMWTDHAGVKPLLEDLSRDGSCPHVSLGDGQQGGHQLLDIIITSPLTGGLTESTCQVVWCMDCMHGLHCMVQHVWYKVHGALCMLQYVWCMMP